MPQRDIVCAAGTRAAGTGDGLSVRTEGEAQVRKAHAHAGGIGSAAPTDSHSAIRLVAPGVFLQEFSCAPRYRSKQPSYSICLEEYLAGRRDQRPPGLVVIPSPLPARVSSSSSESCPPADETLPLGSSSE